jgi:hypothetical protein
MPREPQSYGSNEDWVTGKTDQKVNNPKSAPTEKHLEFYDSKRESETTDPDQGGKTSDVQLADREPEARVEGGQTGDSAAKVNSHEGGAKRDSYFKKRDYE